MLSVQDKTKIICCIFYTMKLGLCDKKKKKKKHIQEPCATLLEILLVQPACCAPCGHPLSCQPACCAPCGHPLSCQIEPPNGMLENLCVCCCP